MLEILNNLRPFFEDCYRRVNVREYARLLFISPPTASNILSNYSKLFLLIKEKDRNYIFFHANNKNKQFIDLSRIYWSIKLNPLVKYLEHELVSPIIVLFGSLSKSEVKEDSDVDLAIFANKKEINVKNFERILKRKIQIFWFKSIKDIKNVDLANNILNSYTLRGRLSL